MVNSGARSWAVGGWLRGLDLGQYEATFRENEIDESVLPSLTAEDLKESASALSVIAGRHFGSARGSSRDAPSPVSVSTRASTPVAAKTAALEAAGERRDVTMMFCDLVEQPAFLRGSTPRSGATWSGRISTPAGGDKRTVVRTAWTSALNPSWATFLSSRAKTRT